MVPQPRCIKPNNIEENNGQPFVLNGRLSLGNKVTAEHQFFHNTCGNQREEHERVVVLQYFHHIGKTAALLDGTG